MQYFVYCIWLPVCSFLWSLFPHKYPVSGTRVRVKSYTHRRSGEEYVVGTIVGPQYDYRGPFDQRSGYPEEGVYFNDNPCFAGLWVVRLDDEVGTLEQHSWERIELVSGYRVGVPILKGFFAQRTRILGEKMRMGNLPHPIEFYPDDWVEHVDDLGTPRQVTDFWFNLDGTLCYTVRETVGEWKEREAKARELARKSRRAVMESLAPGMKYHQITSDTLRLVRRGNFYHLACGKPEDLSFPHVTLEVQFWKGIGIWLNDEVDTPTHEENTREVAMLKLHTGEMDTVYTQREQRYSPIKLPERFQKFRERSRRASLEYLASYAGKYPFDVFTHDELNAFQEFDRGST